MPPPPQHSLLEQDAGAVTERAAALQPSGQAEGADALVRRAERPGPGSGKCSRGARRWARRACCAARASGAGVPPALLRAVGGPLSQGVGPEQGVSARAAPQDECFVTVFGFLPEHAAAVMREFARCGEILAFGSGREDKVNWVHIQFAVRRPSSPAAPLSTRTRRCRRPGRVRQRSAAVRRARRRRCSVTRAAEQVPGAARAAAQRHGVRPHHGRRAGAGAAVPGRGAVAGGRRAAAAAAAQPGAAAAAVPRGRRLGPGAGHTRLHTLFACLARRQLTPCVPARDFS